MKVSITNLIMRAAFFSLPPKKDIFRQCLLLPKFCHGKGWFSIIKKTFNNGYCTI